MLLQKMLLPVIMGSIAWMAPHLAHGSGLPVKAFGAVLPEDIEWAPFPAFPPTARLAVLVGDTQKPGPYVVRVKAVSYTHLTLPTILRV